MPKTAWGEESTMDDLETFEGVREKYAFQFRCHALGKTRFVLRVGARSFSGADFRSRLYGPLPKRDSQIESARSTCSELGWRDANPSQHGL